MKINNYWENNKPQKRHNRTYKGSLTKRNKEKRDKRMLIFIAIWLTTIAYNAIASNSNQFIISNDKVVEGFSTASEATLPVTPERAELETALPEQVMYREFTAYNAGDPFQCDNTPCISASGDNICTLIAQGQIIFASNEFPLGTKLYVEGIGEGIVLDRMNSRFKTRIDYAMQAHEKPRAVAFGLQTLKIKILK